MAIHVAEVWPFRAGQVLSLSFAILFKNIWTFWLLSLVITSPIYIYNLLTGSVQGDASGDTLLYGGAEVIILIFELLLDHLVLAVLVYGTIRDLKGEAVGFGDCFAKGMSVILPVVGVSVAMLVALALVGLVTTVPGAFLLRYLVAGTDSEIVYVVLTMLLVMPLGYVFVRLWVAIPVAVLERRGLQSLRRSAVLTNGYRWRIAGLLILLIAIGFGLSFFIEAVNEIFYATSGRMEHESQIAIEWIVYSFESALSAVIVAVSYRNLLSAKEGLGTEPVAAVFD